MALLVGYPRAGMLQDVLALSQPLAKLVDLHLLVPEGTDTSKASPGARMERIAIPSGRAKRWLRTVSPWHGRRLRRQIAALAPDLIHLTSDNPLFAWLLMGSRRQPILHSVHDPDQHLGEASAWRDRVRYAQYRRCDGIVLFSDHSLRQARHRGLAQRACVVNLGPWCTPAPGDPEGRERVVLFFGRILAYKGLPILTQAFERVAGRHPDWRLVIAGCGDLRLSPGGGRIEVHRGYVDDATAARLFASCAFLAMPYLEATQSNLVATLGAFGKPVVASNVGGLPEAIENGRTGLLVSPGDVGALASALDRLMGDEALVQRLGMAARAATATRLSWERCADGLHEFYTKFARDGPIPARQPPG